MKYPKHLSISSLTKYEECPRCFWLQYIAGFKDKPSPAMALGSEVHFAIAEYHCNREPRHKIGKDACKLFETYTEAVRPSQIGEVEFRFKVPFENLATGERLPFKLKGFVDGIDRKTGWLFEHKTSKSIWKMEDVDTNIQATAYAYGYFMTYGELPKGIRFQILRKLVKPKIQFLETYRTMEDLVWFWNWARNLADGMEQGEFDPKETRFGYHHRLCSYYIDRG